MKILVIGGGGREHALCWKLAQSAKVSGLYAAPGNPGIARVATIAEITDPDLTVVGPEAPLAEGIVDRYRARGLAIVGPTQANAQLEASKINAKELMHRLAIPTARFVRAGMAHEALSSLSKFDYPVVVKADGLAAGKGVVIARDRAEAEAAIRTLGPRLVIEEFLEGEEASFIVLSDGHDFVAFEAAQDHKAAGDGDTGPNTGGMGAYSTQTIIEDHMRDWLVHHIAQPVVTGMKAEGAEFKGVLYCG